MRAFRITAPHAAAIVESPTPDVPEGSALVRVRICGLCGSDLHAYEGTQPFFKYPEIPGHEVVGDIVALGPERPPVVLPNRPISAPWAVGDRVVLDPAVPCGQCFPCRNGRYNCCVNQRVIGVHLPGALAEVLVAPLECLHHIPESMTDEAAALVEPLSIGCEANKRGRVGEGDNVLVIGSGAIGLAVLQVARARGARTVMVCDLSDQRLDMALKLGATSVLNPAREDLAGVLSELTGGDGPSVVVEAVGRPATVLQALELVAASGRVVMLGLCRDDVPLPGALMVRKELDFLGSRLHGGTVPEAVDLIASGAIDPTPMITHRFTLDEAEAGLKLMAAQPDAIVKGIVQL